MTQKELIRQEIERRREANKRQYLSSNGGMSWQRMCGEEDCLVELLSFIDSLPEENNPEPSVYPMEKPIDVFDIKPAPSSADVNWSTYGQGNTTGLDWMHRETSTIPPKKDLYYGD